MSKLFLMIGHYALDTADAVLITYNGEPMHIEWTRPPTKVECLTAIAESQKLTGHKFKSFGHWHNPRTGLHYTGVANASPAPP